VKLIIQATRSQTAATRSARPTPRTWILNQFLGSTVSEAIIAASAPAHGITDGFKIHAINWKRVEKNWKRVEKTCMSISLHASRY
jgi:uncharacterized membrane protein